MFRNQPSLPKCRELRQAAKMAVEEEKAYCFLFMMNLVLLYLYDSYTLRLQNICNIGIRHEIVFSK